MRNNSTKHEKQNVCMTEFCECTHFVKLWNKLHKKVNQKVIEIINYS